MKSRDLIFLFGTKILRLRAAIEIKRAWNFNTIQSDAIKMERYLSHQHAAKTGYVLAYSEATKKRSGRLRKRFDEWEKS